MGQASWVERVQLERTAPPARVELGGMTGGIPRGPYAKSGVHVSFACCPTLICIMPSSQPSTQGCEAGCVGLKCVERVERCVLKPV